MHGFRADTVRAAGNVVDQYCTTTGDFNNVEALNSLVEGAARRDGP